MTKGRDHYVRAMLGPRDDILEQVLRTSLLDEGMPTIQVDDNTGRCLQLLTRLKSPRRALELGTLFGYSAIYLARGLPKGSTLTTVEQDSEAARTARNNLAVAGLQDRVEVVNADATEYLAALPPKSLGMIFLDADKESYLRYLKLSLPLLETGGLLVADDAFGDGNFRPEKGKGREALTIREYAWAVCRSRGLLSFFAGTENGLLVTMKT